MIFTIFKWEYEFSFTDDFSLKKMRDKHHGKSISHSEYYQKNFKMILVVSIWNIIKKITIISNTILVKM